MVKVFDAVSAPQQGHTRVLVNPFTGKIYAFEEARPETGLIPTPSTLIVGVEVSPDVFREEFEKGLFYKEGAFYRSWNPKQNPSQLIVVPKQELTFFAPEEADGEVTVRVYKDENIVWEETAQMEKGEVKFTLPELEPGTYTIRVYSEEYGRLTTDIAVAPAPAPAFEDVHEEFQQESQELEESYVLYRAMQSIDNPEEVANIMTNEVLSKVQTIQEEIVNSSQEKEALRKAKLSAKDKANLKSALANLLKRLKK